MSNVDIMQPFQLRPDDARLSGDGPSMRGRLTRLGPVAHDIISRHDYPEPVGILLGECLALTASLAGGLKFDGIFTLQIQADGPVPLIIADATSTGDLRGYAKFDQQALADISAENTRPIPDFLGKGHLALTVDMGPNKNRYQGVVELTGDTLTDCAHHYFRKSEQMDTAIVLAAANQDGEWRAGSLLLQQLPEDALPQLSSDDGEDPWRRAMMLLATGTQDELLDPELGPDRYLHRLFHQEGLTVSPTRPWARKCRCSADRMQTAIEGLPEEDRRHMTVDGRIEVTCEFCNETRAFSPDSLDII